ncbi:MAG: DUF6290 family protein [Clostridiales Family XIII bacterium]|jgi:hypothetical protein|nr:DUF6290 family protein [Clostridiales Family XIII bacterium]
MSVIQARLSRDEDHLVKQYTIANDISVSTLIRDAVLTKIENEIDLKLYENAMREHERNPQTVDFSEMMRLINE